MRATTMLQTSGVVDDSIYSNVAISGSIRAAVVFIGAFYDSTSTAISLSGGMQHFIHRSQLTLRSTAL